MRDASLRAARAPHALFTAARNVAFAFITVTVVPAFAHDYAVGALKIDHPYARPTPPGARTAGVYFTIRNGGKEADRLVNAKTPAAQSAEIHSMTMQGNLMKMRQVPGVEIPAGGEVAFKSGGYHVMLVGVSHPLAVGDQVPLTLTFEKAGPVQVFANVEAANAKTQQEH